MSTVSGRTHGCQMHIQQDTSFANFHEEQQQYRNAVVGLFEKIRHSNEAELQELLETIRKPRLLSEAVQEALATSGHRNGDFIAETICKWKPSCQKMFAVFNMITRLTDQEDKIIAIHLLVPTSWTVQYYTFHCRAYECCEC